MTFLEQTCTNSPDYNIHVQKARIITNYYQNLNNQKCPLKGLDIKLYTWHTKKRQLILHKSVLGA